MLTCTIMRSWIHFCLSVSVQEPKLNPEKGVRVGERDDTLPPDYRFAKEDPKKHPAPPKKEVELYSRHLIVVFEH